jgi:hypothetical protein
MTHPPLRADRSSAEKTQSCACPLLERGSTKRVRELGGSTSHINPASEAAQRGHYISISRSASSCLYLIGARLVTLGAHEPCPEGAFRLVLIVRAAPEPNPLHRRLPPSRYWVDMIELEEPAGRAAMPGCADEGALALVPLPDRAPDGSRDVAIAYRTASLRRALRPASGGAELPLLDLGDKASSALSSTCATSPGGTAWLSKVWAYASFCCALRDRDLDEEALVTPVLGSRVVNLPRGKLILIRTDDSRRTSHLLPVVNLPRGKLRVVLFFRRALPAEFRHLSRIRKRTHDRNGVTFTSPAAVGWKPHR